MGSYLQNSYALARQWYEKATKQGFAEAQLESAERDGR